MSRAIEHALVTGASGFVGRPLCARLGELGITVSAAGRQASRAQGPWDEYRELDLAGRSISPDLLEGIDTVFHLAGKAHSVSRSAAEAQQHLQLNARGTTKLVRAAVEAGARRLVFISSVKAAVAGDPYGDSKRIAELAVIEASQTGGMHTTILRPSLIYGPGWKGNLRAMEDAVRVGRFPPLPELGNSRSMVYVGDVVEAAILTAQDDRAKGKVYVLTDGERYSTRRIYLAMCVALGRPVPRWTVSLKVLKLAGLAGDAASRLRVPVPFNSAALARLTESAEYDATPITEDLGWRARSKLEDVIGGIVGPAEVDAGATSG